MARRSRVGMQCEGSREGANGIEWELAYGTQGGDRSPRIPDPFSRRPILVRTLLVAGLRTTQARHICFLSSYPFGSAIGQADVRAEHDIPRSSFNIARSG